MSTPVKRYDPGMSKTPDEKLQAYRRAPIDLKTTLHAHVIPGLGPEGSKHLKSVNINTEKELIDKFASLKTGNMTNQQHCDAMYNWLAANGINSHRHEIIQAVSEKTEHLYPPDRSTRGAQVKHHNEEEEVNWGSVFFLGVAIMAVTYSLVYM